MWLDGVPLAVVPLWQVAHGPAATPLWFIVAGVVLSIVALVVIGFIANRALEKVTSEHKGVGIEAED